MSQGTFVGRQPIVDRDQHVVAYELLFRNSRYAQFAEIDEVGRAAVRVIVNTFASLGMDAVLGQSLGFFNVNREVRLSDAIEALPQDRVVIEGTNLDAAKTTLIKRLQQIAAEAESRLIVDSFKQDAKLGLNILRLVNTAGSAVRVRLETIDDAVRHLGLQQLGRWVSILLYAQGDGTDLRSPLLSTAAHRGRLMELVIDGGSVSGEADSRRERAFLVGMLSLADALLGRSIDDLVHELRLGEEIARALTHREGELGELLSFAEAVERREIEKFEDELERWDLDPERLQQLEHNAYAWVHGLIDPESSASALCRVSGILEAC